MTDNKQKNRLVELLEDWGNKENDGIKAKSIADHLLTNNVLVLPHALGSKVWCLGQPCGGCQYFNEPMTEEFIERCRKCDKWEIGECEFDYEFIPEWGELVFPTRELAEEALGKKLEEARNCK